MVETDWLSYESSFMYFDKLFYLTIIMVVADPGKHYSRQNLPEDTVNWIDHVRGFALQGPG